MGRGENLCIRMILFCTIYGCYLFLILLKKKKALFTAALCSLYTSFPSFFKVSRSTRITLLDLVYIRYVP
ncbi:hypothetical protein BDZ91DRAFT_265986 [Kalaharituber pfeilii]|nr:hypothetical protein BDZ91DRAFT_265986 [Kalaharituber pfeilii]